MIPEMSGLYSDQIGRVQGGWTLYSKTSQVLCLVGVRSHHLLPLDGACQRSKVSFSDLGALKDLG